MKSVRTRLWAALLAIAMVVALLPVSALADDTTKGTEENPFTSVTEYNKAMTDSNARNTWSGKDVYLTITPATTNKLTFGVGEFNPTNTQNWTNPPKLHLTIVGATFTGSTWSDTDLNSSFMYLSNCRSLVIDNCNFSTGSGSLVYGINWNLIGIQNATVSITNSTFTGNFAKNAIKLNQRNGADDYASDVKSAADSSAKSLTWNGTAWVDNATSPTITVSPATIQSATISNCTFSGTNAIIALGTQGKADAAEVNAATPGRDDVYTTTGNFPVTISNVRNTTNGISQPVTVLLDYKASKATTAPTIQLESNQVLNKSAYGDPVVTTVTDPVRADLVVTRQPDGSSQPVQVQITLGRVLTGSYGGYYFDHGVATLSVEPGESLYIHDLPANMTYEIAVLDGLMTSETNVSGTTLPGVYTYANFTALPGAGLPEIVPGEEEIVEDGELTEGEEITGGEEEGDLAEGTEETPPEETEELPEEGLEELPEEGEDLPEEPVDVPQTGDAAPAAGAAILFGLALCALALKKVRAK